MGQSRGWRGGESRGSAEPTCKGELYGLSNVCIHAEVAAAHGACEDTRSVFISRH